LSGIPAMAAVLARFMAAKNDEIAALAGETGKCL
jgi:hypothetical protein